MTDKTPIEVEFSLWTRGPRVAVIVKATGIPDGRGQTYDHEDLSKQFETVEDMRERLVGHDQAACARSNCGVMLCDRFWLVIPPCYRYGVDTEDAETFETLDAFRQIIIAIFEQYFADIAVYGEPKDAESYTVRFTI